MFGPRKISNRFGRVCIRPENMWGDDVPKKLNFLTYKLALGRLEFQVEFLKSVNDCFKVTLVLLQCKGED